MRALVAIAIFVGGLAGNLAGVPSARAADRAADRSETYSTRSPGIGLRIGQMVVYDFQPGVVVRAYWRAPWRNRHYFPTTGEKPEIGRDEDLSVTSRPSEPAETFQRYWSTSSAFLPEAPRGRVPPLDAEQPPLNPAPLK